MSEMEKTERTSNGRGAYGCIGFCLLLPAAAIVFAALALGWMYASAGLAAVPVFSNFAYRAPLPIHPVALQAGAGASKVFSSPREFFAQANPSGLPSPGKPLTIDLPESILTDALRRAASAERNTQDFVDLSRAQIASSKEKGIEAFLPLKGNALGSAVRLYVRPSVENGSVMADLTDAWIGNFRVPPWIVSRVNRDMLRKAVRDAAGFIQEVATFTNVEAGDGFVRLEGTFSISPAP